MKEETKLKRQELSERSKEVRPLIERGEYDTINQAVIDTFYKVDGHEEFKTIHQWNKDGKRVKRGETAFLVWAKPIDELKAEKEGHIIAPEHQDGPKFFPLCFLFSNKQVEAVKQ